MKNPLDSLWGTIISGLILTAILYYVVKSIPALRGARTWISFPRLARWLHFMAGIMWIGLLYYFNFVQVAALKAATADGTAAGITKHVAPRALLYFRWAARRDLARRRRAARQSVRQRVHAAARAWPASASAPGSARSCCSTSGR